MSGERIIMLDSIKKLFKVITDFRDWFSREFSDQQLIVLPPGVTDKRSNPEILWKRYRLRFILGLLKAFMSIAALGIFITYFAIFSALFDLIAFDDAIRNFIIENDIFLSKSLQVPIYILLGVTLFLVAVFSRRNSLSRSQSSIFVSIVLVLLVLNSTYSIAEKVLVRQNLAQTFNVAEREMIAGNFETASALNISLLESGLLNRDLTTRVEANQIGVRYHLSEDQFDFKNRIIESCRWLVTEHEHEYAESIIIALHLSIHKLGQTISLGDAEPFLEEIHRTEGLICSREASPVFLFVNPRDIQKVSRISDEQDFQYSSPLKDYPSWTINNNEQNDLDRILNKIPQDKYVDKTLFLLGRYDILVEEYEHSVLHPIALFELGRTAFSEGNIDGAIVEWNRFITNYISHPWRNDAFDWIGRSYEVSGDKIKALEWYLLAKSEPHGGSSCHECSYLNLADTQYSSVELENFIAAHTNYPFVHRLEFVLGEKYFDEGYYVKARDQYVLFSNTYRGSGGIPITDQADERVNALNQIILFQMQSEPESLYLTAQFILENPDFEFQRMLNPNYYSTFDTNISFEEFETRTPRLQIVNLLEEFVRSYPSHQYAPWALSTIADTYVNASVTASYYVSDDVVTVLRQKASETNWKLLVSYGGNINDEVFDRALEQIALIHLSDGVSFSNAPPVYLKEDIDLMQNAARELVEEFPDHHLANNFLNWIAWGYCYKANLYNITSLEYEINYELALSTYQEILAKYGAEPRIIWSQITVNAEENISIISDKLNDPTKREPIPIENWYWP